MHKKALAVILLAAWSVAWSGVAQADFAAGVAAYKAADYARAYAVFEPLATAGDRRAQFALGLLYDSGEGVARDDAQAARWYRASAEQGFSKAQYNLGRLIEQARVADTPPAAAHAWFLAAAARGNPDAVARAHRYAENGDVAAQRQLGRMYYFGIGVPRDLRDAYGWYRRAARAGDADAAFAVAAMIEQGSVNEPLAAAVEWYEQAAAAGNARAQYNLARHLRVGLAVAPDRPRARQLYERAARGGLPEAALALGMLLEAGGGRSGKQRDRRGDKPKSHAANAAAALPWYEQAARAGLADAQVNLAWLLAHGHGVAADPITACAWLRLAADQHHPLAADNLELLLSRLDPVSRNAVAPRAAELATAAEDDAAGAET